MRCPHCSNGPLRVEDSRQKGGILVVRRRRKCRSCGYCVVTIETYERFWRSVEHLLNVTEPPPTTNRR